MKLSYLEQCKKKVIRIFLVFGIIIGVQVTVNAQVHKEECLEGDCKNGYGLKKITTTYIDPRNVKQKHTKWARKIFTYYLAGEFKSKELNGDGYRFELKYGGAADENKIKQFIKDEKKLMPDEKLYTWFEHGEYRDNILNGKGFLIEYNTYNGIPERIREGEFKDGALNGKGVKYIFGNWGNFKDSVSGKYILKEGRIFEGRFDQDLCMECTVTEKLGNREGHMTGKAVSENFFSGWMMSDYSFEFGKIVNIPLRHVLYIGGEVIASLKSGGLSTNIRTVNLENGAVYTGECDAEGQPYGFGTLESKVGYIYEGQVDNGHPEGYGWYHFNDGFKYYPEQQAEGGLYRNKRFVYGAFYKPGVYELIKGGVDNPDGNSLLNSSMQEVMTGPFTKKRYSYNEVTGKYKLEREESGVKKDGSIVNSYVAVGMTKEERIKQRIVTNGSIKISDLVIGDVVVRDGFASPVVKLIGGLFYLKNGKYFSSVSAPIVQLSKYILADFDLFCKECNGSGSISYTYQRPPEQVEEFYYRTETVVGDYTILTHPVLAKATVTKTFPPVKRISNCAVCAGTGILKNISELKEQ